MPVRARASPSPSSSSPRSSSASAPVARPSPAPRPAQKVVDHRRARSARMTDELPRPGRSQSRRPRQAAGADGRQGVLAERDLGRTSGQRSTARTSSSTSATATATRTRTAPAPSTRDRVNGWGLNTRRGRRRRRQHASRTWCIAARRRSAGTLTAADGAAQRTYCGGTDNDGITPAPGLHDGLLERLLHPGRRRELRRPGDRGGGGDARRQLLASGLRARRARPTSPPTSARGSSSTSSCRNPGTAFGQLFEMSNGYDPAALRVHLHPHFGGGRQIWIQKTDGPGDRPDYFYAFAGNPSMAPERGHDLVHAAGPAALQRPGGLEVLRRHHLARASRASRPAAAARSSARTAPSRAARWRASSCARSTCPRRGRTTSATTTRTSTRPTSTRWPRAGITSGCADGRFCPDGLVTRAQMATLPDAGAGARLDQHRPLQR